VFHPTLGLQLQLAYVNTNVRVLEMISHEDAHQHSRLDVKVAQDKGEVKSTGRIVAQTRGPCDLCGHSLMRLLAVLGK
jgi:hypothetical protein